MSRPLMMDEAVRTAVYALFVKAREALTSGDPESAKHLCEEAWKLIPEPKYSWDTSYMCVLGIVELLRGAGEYDRAISIVDGYLSSGYYSDFEDGPYFWLGTLNYEKGEFGEAFSYFDRANRMSRGRCFKEEDPRYKSFFQRFKTDGQAH